MASWDFTRIDLSLESVLLLRFQQLILREIGLRKNSLIRFGKSLLIKKEEQKYKENI